jgi:hypothetical protein
MAIATGVIDVVLMSAVVALQHMTAKERGAAMLDVAKRSLLTRPKRVLAPIEGRVLADNIRHL